MLSNVWKTNKQFKLLMALRSTQLWKYDLTEFEFLLLLDYLKACYFNNSNAYLNVTASRQTDGTNIILLNDWIKLTFIVNSYIIFPNSFGQRLNEKSQLSWRMQKLEIFACFSVAYHLFKFINLQSNFRRLQPDEVLRG